ncbi:hypothetical protein [Spongiactinospora sp. 9N601]|uniref:hypothetical protein n=1 Tax=Spongiactinospora sp. 9N601 TaxID=3375149 RepID=UPI0037973026
MVVHHFGSTDALIAEAFTYTVRQRDGGLPEPGTGKVTDFAAGLSTMVMSGPETRTSSTNCRSNRGADRSFSRRSANCTTTTC